MDVSERPKTVAHMQKLMALAALASCNKRCDPTDHGYGVVDPMPMPADAAGIVPVVIDSGTTATVDATTTAPVDASTTDATASKDGGKTVKIDPIDIKHVETHPTSYGVVDPLPPPSLYRK